MISLTCKNVILMKETFTVYSEVKIVSCYSLQLPELLAIGKCPESVEQLLSNADENRDKLIGGTIKPSAVFNLDLDKSKPADLWTFTPEQVTPQDALSIRMNTGKSIKTKPGRGANGEPTLCADDPMLTVSKKQFNMWDCEMEVEEYDSTKSDTHDMLDSLFGTDGDDGYEGDKYAELQKSVNPRPRTDQLG